MQFDNFEIHASPHITNATCPKCEQDMIEVSNGWFSKAMFCKKCENVYVPKLVKVREKNISKEFLEQCRIQAKKKYGEQNDLSIL